MNASTVRTHGIHGLLLEVQRRLPAGQRFVQEAFTSEHRRPVLVKLNEISADTFYLFDEITACAFSDALIDWATRHSGGRLTVSYPAFGEFRGQRNRLEHAASKVGRVRALTIGQPALPTGGSAIEVCPTNGSILSRYRIALKEGQPGALFICEQMPGKLSASVRYLGFFTSNAETVDEIAEDIDLVASGRARRVASFDRLRLLHQTTQKVVRELESYSRRMELAIRRARRRPDLLTPARFERIVRQSIAKMEQLKEIPRRALRAIDHSD